MSTTTSSPLDPDCWYSQSVASDTVARLGIEDTSNQRRISTSLSVSESRSRLGEVP